jgi:hypothetical protein
VSPNRASREPRRTWTRTSSWAVAWRLGNAVVVAVSVAVAEEAAEAAKELADFPLALLATGRLGRAPVPEPEEESRFQVWRQRSPESEA